MKETVLVYFITGFLGSGKTTFLAKLLQMIPEEKIGLIINEFGQVNIDGAIIREGSHAPIAEISGGQVFCGCVSGSFVESICEFLKLPIRHLIVETSGMANPFNINTVLEAVKMKAKEDWEYKGMICIVDPTRIVELADCVNAVREQVAKSEFLVVNKIDLVDEEQLKKVDDLIEDLNPEASVLKTTYGSIDERDFLNFLNGRPFGLTHIIQKIESDFKRPLNYFLKAGSPEHLEKIVAFSEEMLPLNYRIKGYARVGDKVYRINSVNEDVNVKHVDVERDGVELILISSEGDIKDKIEDAWKRNVGTELELTEKGKEFWD